MAESGLFSLARLREPVSHRHADFGLLICSFVTGLIDAAAFLNWGVFVAMQTGNTVILGLSTAGLPHSQPYSWASTLVSLSSFLLGAFATSTLSRLARNPAAAPPHHLTRLKATTLFLAQAALVAVAAALVAVRLVPVVDPSRGEDAGEIAGDARILVAIPALAAQSGVQIAASRVLGFPELPVNVLTSAYADAVGDPGLFARGNAKRNRRVVAAVLTIGGAVAAAWMLKKGRGVAELLWLAAAIKLAVAAGMWAFLLPEEKAEEEEDLLQ